MSRTVFFSFHYEDVKDFRANVVRNSWVTKSGDESSFIDGSIWETAKRKGVQALKNLIDDGLNGTSVTTVLIGEETYDRRWVKYEIVRSFEKGNGILGIYINRIPDKNQYITAKGLNPLDRLSLILNSDFSFVEFEELENGKWQPFKDLPKIRNNKTNTIHFENWGIFGSYQNDKRYRLSEIFKTYDWINDGGYDNFSDWVKKAAKQARR